MAHGGEEERQEARLNAHREVLTALVAALLAGEGPARRSILRQLGFETVAGDGQEDPGAVPAEGFALENAIAEEIRAILQAARARAAAAGVAKNIGEGGEP